MCEGDENKQTRELMLLVVYCESNIRKDAADLL